MWSILYFQKKFSNLRSGLKSDGKLYAKDANRINNIIVFKKSVVESWLWEEPQALRRFPRGGLSFLVCRMRKVDLCWALSPSQHLLKFTGLSPVRCLHDIWHDLSPAPWIRWCPLFLQALKKSLLNISEQKNKKSVAVGFHFNFFSSLPQLKIYMQIYNQL